MPSASWPRGLYAVTPDWLDTDRLLACVERAIEGGAVVVQYRNKLADARLRQLQATRLLALCRLHQVPLIINDHLDLMLGIDADGLHLGGGDGDLAAARAALGADKWLGASCYADLLLAAVAVNAGASYVAFGAAYVSATKPNAPHASLAIYQAACARFDCPVVAIGGITPRNAAPLVQAGIHNLAVIGALFDSADVSGTSKALSTLFD